MGGEPGYEAAVQHSSPTESLLFKACKGQCFDKELDLVCNFFYNDFNKEDLVAELSTFHKHYLSAV